MPVLGNVLRVLNNLKDELPKDTILTHVQSKFATGGAGDDFSHIYRRKTRLQMCLISACVCGIEFCYAAETAFVTPILLQIGVPVLYMTLVWCLSPLLGIFLVPLLGSLSDRCPYRMGRRRPFILLLSCGIVVGLVLVPEGKSIGKLLGDVYAVHSTPRGINLTMAALPGNNVSWTHYHTSDTPLPADAVGDISMTSPPAVTSEGQTAKKQRLDHPWSILFTVVGVVLLDFSCDACQSPCRAYMLDVTTIEDHPVGLSTFTVLAGMGGSLGYVFGGIHWGSTELGASFGSHVRVVFTMVLVIYMVCLLLTVTSIKEVPLEKLGINEEDLQNKKMRKDGRKYKKFTNEEEYDEDSIDAEQAQIVNNGEVKRYGLEETSLCTEKSDKVNAGLDKTLCVDRSIDKGIGDQDVCSYQNPADPGQGLADKPETGQLQQQQQQTTPIIEPVSLKTYLKSIVQMPHSLFILCLTNLFCWMSLVCYSLYFTDFVGQAVFGGDPSAPEGSPAYILYESGVRTGSFGMALYSFSCSIYSLVLEKIIQRFGARRVYILSQLVYTVGSLLMALTRHPVAVILLSPTAGIMYATLFTMPYVLVATYHSSNTFHNSRAEGGAAGSQVRGIGTDVALVSSMVFVAQFLLSSFMGSIIHYSGSTVAVIISASILSACGAVSATQVLYLDL